VLWHQPSATDLLFITLRKSEPLFSPPHQLPRPGPCSGLNVAVVMEIEMAFRLVGEADETEHGAGCQNDEAAALIQCHRRNA